MQSIGTISAEQFMLHFYEDIRVQIDWPNLLVKNLTIECIQIQNRNDLGELYTVWGKDVNNEYTQNHSLTVKDSFPKSCETALNNFSKQFLNLEVVLISAPAYKCNCGKYVLLDRTHRSITLYRHNTERFRMIVYPIDAKFAFRDKCTHDTG